MYIASMLNHAQHKNNTRKRRVGVAVGKRFKVEAYFETRAQIELIDRFAGKRNKSRSEYVADAAMQRVERERIEETEGEQIV